VAPARPLAEKFSYLKGVLAPIEMCVKFSLSSSSSFRDMRVVRIYTSGHCAPHTPLAEKFSYLERVLGPI